MDGCGGREEGGKVARKSTEEGGNDEGRCVVTVDKGGGGVERRLMGEVEEDPHNRLQLIMLM